MAVKYQQTSATISGHQIWKGLTITRNTWRVHETNIPWIGDIINHAVHNLRRNWNFNSPRSRKKISMSHHSTRKPWCCVTEAFKTLYVVYFVPPYLMLKISCDIVKAFTLYTVHISYVVKSSCRHARSCGIAHCVATHLSAFVCEQSTVASLHGTQGHWLILP